MRLPNGYGSVTKLKGKRRKPWMVRVTKGFKDDGTIIREVIGYFEKRQDALDALTRYHKNPLLLDNENATFAEVYEKWKEERFPNLSDAAQKGYIFGYNKCSSLYSMKMKDIKATNLQAILNDMEDKYSRGSKRKVKSFLNQIFIFSVVNDIVDKNYAQYIELGKNTFKVNRKPFSKDEIKKLFKLVNEDGYEFIDTVLIMIYTGFRIGELLSLKNKDVNLIDKIIKGGAKTEAGKDRLVPIHPKIYNLVVNRYDSKNEYFVTNFKGEQMKYNNYKREKWEPLMKVLGMKHNPHDCRHTFATLLNNAGANGTSIKKLIGHNSFTFTEKYYTHKDIEELRAAIEKM